ncbi:MAG TPA: hypothetical protein DCY20_01535, partial [Firmicutes bacterium]|nr:hypothetical protein [Bacillota bacterium]
SVLFLFDQKVDGYEIQQRALELLPKYHKFSTQQREIVETWIENTFEHQLAKFLIKLLKLTPEEGAQMIANNSRAFSELEEAAEARGEKKGIEKGIQKGIQKGIEKANIETAINLLKLKTLDDETIAASVGLPLEMVQQLKQEVME